MRARLLVAMLLLTSTLLSPLSAPAALAAPASQATSDPGARGSHAVSTTGYDGGDTFYTPPGWTKSVEIRAKVHYPTDIANGPYPLIVLLHGMHGFCYSAAGTFAAGWPCPAGFQSLPSYLGYDYLADLLASQGFIVVSVSANGINAYDQTQSSDFGMTARGQLVLAHLQLWASFNTTNNGTFGTLFIGRVNMNSIGLMGHSRGGEGVVRAYQLNAANGSPFGIRAVFPLAPVAFNRFVINNVPMAVLLPYCDGDVSDLQGVHYYDDSRYNVAGDTAPKHTILVMGANHNFYNTVWTPGAIPGGSDDWLNKEANIAGTAIDPFCNPTTGGNGRLSAAQQRATGIAYMATFFRLYLRGETAFAPILQGDSPAPASAQTSAIKVSYHAPFTAAARRDINRYLSATNLTTNTLGGAVTTTSLAQHALCGGDAPQPVFCLSTSTALSHDREPHGSPTTNLSTRRGPGQLNIQWTTTAATYRNAIPAGSRNISGFSRLQFRVSTVWGNSANPAGTPKNFRVILTDGAGRSTAIPVSDYSNALEYPPGNLDPVTPKAVLNMARIPLFAFVGLDLTDIRSVDFRFDQQATGWLLITDLAFASIVPVPPPTVSGTTPTSALRGQNITISGTNLAGATSVRFNGTAATFAVMSNTQIAATVPNGATTGPISVTTPGGTAASSANFTVFLDTGRVGVQVGDQPGPTLSATLTARPACGSINNIQFGNPGAPFSNAIVTITSPGGGPGNQSTGFTYTPPASTTTVSLLITRATPSGSATVSPIRLTDACGVWTTLVGGGPNAFN